MGGAVVAVALLVGTLSQSPSESDTGAPRFLRFGGGRPVEIARESYLHYGFTLPPGTCTVTGQLQGLAGETKDFQAFLMDDDDYRGWLTSHEAQVYWQTDQVAAATINARVPGPGTFHLVVTNTSRLAPKTVAVQAQVECP